MQNTLLKCLATDMKKPPKKLEIWLTKVVWTRNYLRLKWKLVKNNCKKTWISENLSLSLLNNQNNNSYGTKDFNYRSTS